MIDKSRVVILGGAGFIGSHMVEELVGAGYLVRVFDKLNCDWGNLAAVASQIERLEGDFLNQVDVRQALEGCDVAVHLISATLPGNSNENPVYDVEANVVSTLRLLDVARASRLKRVLFISSGGTIYGPARCLPITEEHPTEPLCSYGIGKLMIEKYLRLYQHLHGLEYHVLRFSNPYGERQNPEAAQGAVAVFLGRVAAGRPIEVWGGGQAVRDYIYIKDAVSAFRLVLEQDPPDRLFNVGSGQGTSVNELIEAIRRTTGHLLEVTHRKARPLDVPANVLNSGRIERAVGWRVTTSLDVGLARTWRWLQENSPAALPREPRDASTA